MLCNLSDVLWQGEAKWQPPSMGDLIDEGQLRKHYMKACRVVHPDKQAGQSVERRYYMSTKLTMSFFVLLGSLIE